MLRKNKKKIEKKLLLIIFKRHQRQNYFNVEMIKLNPSPPSPFTPTQDNKN